MNAFSIDYSLVAEADLSGFKQYEDEKEEKACKKEANEEQKQDENEDGESKEDNDEESNNADAKFGYKPFEFEVIQNYNPIYGLFFKMRDANYNRIGLNHNYRIRDYGKDGLWNLTGPSGEVAAARRSARNSSSVASPARRAPATTPLQRARHANCSSVTPRVRTVSSGRQQSRSSSLYQRHGPFQTRPGSTPSALSATTSVPSPQNAGSACVWNCSASANHPSMLPSASASRNNPRPSALAKGISAAGSGRR